MTSPARADPRRSAATGAPRSWPSRSAHRPEHFGVTHWSSRLLADQPGVSHHRGPRLGRARPQTLAAGDLQVLHRPAREAKVRDVVGLYLDPPERAVVVCLDEKSQIQTLQRPAAAVAPG